VEELPVESDEWGPVELPFLDADEYLVRLHGDDLMPKVARFHPLPGETRSIDLDAEYGYIQWFFAVNEEEEMLHEAEVTLRWLVDGRYVEHRVAARPDGYIPIAGIPPGTVQGEARCPGYVTETLAPMEVPDPEEFTFRVVLARAGAIRGTCLARGAPVPDFEVHVWPVDAPWDAATHRFSGADGRFEIDAPLKGVINLTASAAGVGISDPVQTVVDAGDPEELVLALVTDVRAHGTVVDAETGAVIPDATARVLLGDEYNPLAEVGSPRRSDPSGRIELSGLSRGEALVRVSTPGYGSVELAFTTLPGEDVDLGVIALTRMYPLIVELRTNDFDPTGIVLAVRGPELLARKNFDPDGRVEFESVNAGGYGLVAEFPDGTTIATQVDLVPGWIGYVVLDATGAGALHVEAVEANGEPVRDAIVVAENLEGRQLMKRYAPLDEGGRVTLRNLPAGEFDLDVRDPRVGGRGSIAKSRVVLSEGAEDTVRIVAGEGDLTVRVVDRSGAPIPGARLLVTLADSDFAWSESLRTDAAGECLVPSVGDKNVLCHLYHPAHGHRVGIEVRGGAVEDVVELELAGDVAATFVVSTVRGPAVGLEIQLFDAHGGYRFPRHRTDSSGAVTWHGLSEGEYLLGIVDARYWWTVQSVRVDRDQAITRVQTRRRCSLSILARSQGRPLEAFPLELVWLDETQSVAELLSERRVLASDPELRTSAQGVLRVTHAPEGRYRWTASLGDETYTDVFEVEPDVENEVVVDLP
jgi:hypothetical protein